MNDTVTMLRHDDTVFEDQILYVTGNAYFGCEFHRCTMIFRGFPCAFDTCEFRGCIWHVDCLFHDQEQLKQFREVVLPLMQQTIPKQSTRTGADADAGSEQE